MTTVKEWTRLAEFGDWVALEHKTRLGSYAIGNKRSGLIILKNSKAHALYDARKKRGT